MLFVLFDRLKSNTKELKCFRLISLVKNTNFESNAFF